MKSLKYLAALSIPMVTIGALFYKGAFSYATLVYAFILIPLLEILLKESTENDPDEVVQEKKKSRKYDYLLYVNLPIVYGILIWSLLIVSKQNLSVFELVGLVLSVGVCLGTNGINVAHELGHRKKTYEKIIAKILLLPSYYMHFFIEHNWGHHTYAATKEDPATAVYNQSVFGFWVSSVTRQYVKAWRIQKNLNNSNQISFWHIKNDMLWYVLFQTAYTLAVLYTLGLKTMIFAVCAGIVGFLLLETVNYIEHYGLLRSKNEQGRYEPVRAIHSWNSNHVVGRIVLYELTRHSDHHYKAAKKYQTLICHQQAPQMPFGYPTAMVISLFPPLWFALMNKRVPAHMKSLALA